MGSRGRSNTAAAALGLSVKGQVGTHSTRPRAVCPEPSCESSRVEHCPRTRRGWLCARGRAKQGSCSLPRLRTGGSPICPRHALTVSALRTCSLYVQVDNELRGKRTRVARRCAQQLLYRTSTCISLVTRSCTRSWITLTSSLLSDLQGTCWWVSSQADESAEVELHSEWDTHRSIER